MAEAQETVDTQKVYTYDAVKTSHPLISEDDLPVDQALEANQTTVKPADGTRYWNGTAWVEELVIAYEFDSEQDNLYKGVAFIPQGAVLAPNQTFVKPQDGLYQPMRFNGIEWVGTPKEEWDKAHPAPVTKPSETTLAMNALGQQLVQAKAESDKTSKSLEQKVDDLTKSVNMLGQMIAKTQTAQGGTN
ncbi:MAG: hypothetical protein ACI31O_03640 [Limosilactobacillus vaginalis]|uniref:hypothetical protein n=1 Tax=Limosilactobacillus vaginalis TaxID=1633 RepID=UPI003F03DA72